MKEKELIEGLIKEIDDAVALDTISGGTANKLKHIIYQLDEIVNPVEAIVRQGRSLPDVACCNCLWFNTGRTSSEYLDGHCEKLHKSFNKDFSCKYYESKPSA